MARNPMFPELVAGMNVVPFAPRDEADPDGDIELIEFDTCDDYQDYRDYMREAILGYHCKVARLKAEMRVAKAEAKMASLNLDLLLAKQKLESLKEHYAGLS